MNAFESETLTAQQPEPSETQTETQTRIERPASVPEAKHEQGQSAPKQETVGELEFAQLLPSELSFACLLIPRFHDHHLAGDITDYLVEWMRQICISYGWRLDAIVIRPGYLHWVMTVPLNATPAQFIRTIRQLTSQKIFEDFPRYKQKNLSGQFWAPGNLVLPGNQLLTLENINSFIVQIRRQQGIT